MEPVDWGQAWSIVFGGITAVFFIMSMLALITHLMGKIFQGIEKRKKAAEAASGKEAKA